jgi:general secretion pathway protein N
MLFKRWLAIAVFILSFSGVSLANLPLSLFLNETRLSQSGLTATAISGTLWRGDITGLSLGTHPLGDIHLKANPLSLLRLGYGGKAHIAPGAAKGQGKFLLQSGPALMAEDIAIIIDLAKLGYRDPNGRPLRGQLSLDVSKLHLQQKKNQFSCKEIEGRITSDALSILGQYYNKELPILRGTLNCEQGQVVLAIAGQNQIVTIDITAEINANLDYMANIIVETDDSEMQSLLALYGFNSDGNRYTLFERSNFAQGWR